MKIRKWQVQFFLEDCPLMVNRERIFHQIETIKTQSEISITHQGEAISNCSQQHSKG